MDLLDVLHAALFVLAGVAGGFVTSRYFEPRSLWSLGVAAITAVVAANISRTLRLHSQVEGLWPGGLYVAVTVVVLIASYTLGLWIGVKRRMAAGGVRFEPSDSSDPL